MTRIKQLAAWIGGSVEFTRGVVIYLVLAVIRDWFWENSVISNTIFAIQLATLALLFGGIYFEGGPRIPRTRWFPYIMVGAMLLGAASAFIVIKLAS